MPGTSVDNFFSRQLHEARGPETQRPARRKPKKPKRSKLLKRIALASAIALVADLYGRHFIRALRHPTQYWGWMLLFVAITIALIAGGIMLNRRLETAPAE